LAHAVLGFACKEIGYPRASVLASSGTAQMGKENKKPSGFHVNPFTPEMSELS
jgi:hypothetical protein